MHPSTDLCERAGLTLQALVFDVDGTLAETEEARREAFNEAFRVCGLDWSWSPEVYGDLLRVIGGKQRITAYIARLPLEAVASTTSPENFESLITVSFGREALGWFSAVVTGDLVHRQKPFPDVYNLALDQISE